MTDKKQQGKLNREWGAEAENIAAQWLLTQGYVIRERNWRIGNTIEIDIIAELPGTIVFVEVKARKGDMVEAVDTIDIKKIRKMVKGANSYLISLPGLFKYRFDIITITGTSENHKIEHFPDAFLPPLASKK